MIDLDQQNNKSVSKLNTVTFKNESDTISLGFLATSVLFLSHRSDAIGRVFEKIVWQEPVSKILMGRS
jgi:hypothetical protein